MQTNSDIVARLDSTLRKYNPTNYKKLLPPLEDETRNEIVKRLNISSPWFQEIYNWKNGFRPYDLKEGNDCPIFELGGLMGVENVETAFNQNNSQLDYWPSKFIPFVEDFTGLYLLLNNDRNDKFYESIYYYDPYPYVNAENPILCYDSFESFIATSISAYEQGIFSVEQNIWSTLNVDVARYSKLGRELNPESKYFRL